MVSGHPTTAAAYWLLETTAACHIFAAGGGPLPIRRRTEQTLLRRAMAATPLALCFLVALLAPIAASMPRSVEAEAAQTLMPKAASLPASQLASLWSLAMIVVLSAMMRPSLLSPLASNNKAFNRPQRV